MFQLLLKGLWHGFHIVFGDIESDSLALSHYKFESFIDHIFVLGDVFGVISYVIGVDIQIICVDLQCRLHIGYILNVFIDQFVQFYLISFWVSSYLLTSILV